MIETLRYAIDQIRQKGHEAHWWRQRFVANVAGPVLSTVYWNPGVDVMERDWDTLLVLDACRADAFEECTDTEDFDAYEPIHSAGCSSPEWMGETFAGETYPDTVYVSANPFISKVAPDSFHALYNVWMEEFETTDEQIADADGLGQLGTDRISIPADTVNDVARRAHEAHPNKRLIVHYLQPHYPFVGNPDGTPKEWGEVDHECKPGKPLLSGDYSREEIWDAYTDNLRYVLVHAEALAEDLDGRAAFTADHGELFGEWLWPFPLRGVGHPSGVRHPALTEVPWAIREFGERREVTTGTVDHHEADEDYLDDRLRDLGYKV